jgi:hypothetical protein
LEVFELRVGRALSLSKVAWAAVRSWKVNFVRVFVVAACFADGWVLTLHRFLSLPEPHLTVAAGALESFCSDLKLDLKAGSAVGNLAVAGAGAAFASPIFCWLRIDVLHAGFSALLLVLINYFLFLLELVFSVLLERAFVNARVLDWVFLSDGADIASPDAPHLLHGVQQEPVHLEADHFIGVCLKRLIFKLLLPVFSQLLLFFLKSLLTD